MFKQKACCAKCPNSFNKAASNTVGKTNSEIGQTLNLIAILQCLQCDKITHKW